MEKTVNMINDKIYSFSRFINSKFKILHNTHLFKAFNAIFNSEIVNAKREMVLYLIFGVLTTVVNIGSYLLFAKVFGINNLLSNILAWFFSIVFAYITNRIYVFESKNENILHEFALFIGGRGLSGILDSLLFYILVIGFMFNDFISKIVINIIVIIINYVLSKKVIFKEK